MPELPEVETVRRGLAPALEGRRIEAVVLNRPDLRIPFPPDFIRRVQGARVSTVSRRAKYLLWALDSGDTLIAHLGMSGRFTLHKNAPNHYEPHDHAAFRLDDGKVLIYNDPRRFGLMTIGETNALAAHPLLAHLGAEPLERGFSTRYLKQALSGGKRAVKVALMDQELVVGVGNIYASEACFLTGLHPATPAADATAQAAALVKSVKNVLQSAIASGGSSLKDFWHIDGGGGYFQHHFHVYGKAGKPCSRCNTTIRQVTLGGRSTFFCPACQAK